MNEQMFDFLKNKILIQEYAAGQRLHKDQQKEKLGTSSAPTKDALNKLAGEGLVESVSRRGVFVSKSSKRETGESENTIKF